MIKIKIKDMKKKQYVKPAMTVIEVETQQILSMSGDPEYARYTDDGSDIDEWYNGFD